jgi:hypothetical protein
MLQTMSVNQIQQRLLVLPYLWSGYSCRRDSY